MYIYSAISSSVCCHNGLVSSGGYKWICLMKLALFFTNVCAGWLPVAITFKIFDYYFQKSCP